MIKYPATMQEIYRRSKAMNKLFFDLRRDGMTYIEIGQLMECSASWARQRVMRYKELIEEGVVHE
jgi:DNA-directed RNA polymerase specialized sigma24 family protein|tara:strand:+ start:925 stop:1119 length:195 start_codon:yes stop_codon:yes gene_type:complete